MTVQVSAVGDSLYQDNPAMSTEGYVSTDPDFRVTGDTISASAELQSDSGVLAVQGTTMSAPVTLNARNGSAERILSRMEKHIRCASVLCAARQEKQVSIFERGRISWVIL